MNNSRIVPVFQALAEDIHALGVRTVFGLMSDDTAVFAVTLDGLGVRFVGARHENNAIAMAEGYSYATGELGVALIGRGRPPPTDYTPRWRPGRWDPRGWGPMATPSVSPESAR